MRTMEIPPFPRKIEIRDFNNLFRTRLSQKVVMWPEQAIPLLGYMCCPNDPAGREALRGGPSIGKSITLAATNANSCGTGAATFWKNWSTYKDVAHLIAAATLICAEARTRYRNKPLWPGGLSWSQFIPFQMTMLMPDLVLAVGLEFERVGLSALPPGRTAPILDPAAVWRIPPDINVVPIPPPIRKIRAEDLVVLNHRRAGSRGKANVTRTTPDFG